MTHLSTNILEGLNSEQQIAVKTTEGPVLIVAGAGSGKTRVLTSRIAYLLASGVKASQILSLTFTKKAAGEMKDRIALMVGDRNARHLVMGTFHAVFVRFLREFAESIGYPTNFTIYDTSDSQSAMKTCIKELGLDDKVYKPKEVLSRISMAKNNLITHVGYRNNRELLTQDSHSRKPRLCELYTKYQEKLKAAGVMDFDDILLNMNILLRDNKDALLSICDRFGYIMVDEYQDTNYAQYLILKKLSQFHHNICVVGDDSQSIYAFRGAKIENILNFKKDYPECKIIRLERNYRSTSTIVDAANSLIAHNQGRIPKNCYADGDKGEKIKILKSYSEGEEAAIIVSEIISRMRADTAQYQDFAILYRTNAQSRVIEEQLRRRNIPYMIYSGNSFFDRAEVKDMMAYFKLCVNPQDDESFKRVVNKPARGIGGTSIAQLEDLARIQGTSLFKAGFEHPKVKPFCEMINKLAMLAATGDAHSVALKIAEDSSLYAFYKADTSMEGLGRTANIEELLNSVAVFVEDQKELAISNDDIESEDQMPIFTLADFLEDTSLLSNVDVSDDEETNNKVALMTVHSAKGLEFPYVFVAGLEENLFPSLSMMSSSNDIEEERRLFYVAITRAEKAVALAYATERMRNGKRESNPPSRFIREIDSQYLDKPLFNDEDNGSWSGFGSRGASSFGRSNSGIGRTSSPYGASGKVSYFKSEPKAGTTAIIKTPPKTNLPIIDKNFQECPMTDLREGMRIEHNRFGAGTILELSGRAPDMKANIEFDLHGKKLLILKYAKLRPLK